MAHYCVRHTALARRFHLESATPEPVAAVSQPEAEGTTMVNARTLVASRHLGSYGLPGFLSRCR